MPTSCALMVGPSRAYSCSFCWANDWGPAVQPALRVHRATTCYPSAVRELARIPLASEGMCELGGPQSGLTGYRRDAATFRRISSSSPLFLISSTPSLAHEVCDKHRRIHSGSHAAVTPSSASADHFNPLTNRPVLTWRCNTRHPRDSWGAKPASRHW